MKEKLMVIGASGHGKVIAEIAEQMRQWNDIVFLDDAIEKKTCSKYRVLNTTDQLEEYVHDHAFVVAIGNNAIRKTFIDRLKVLNADLPILKHPSAVVSSSTSIGEGTVIMAGVVINCDVSIGAGSIINTRSTVDHDCTIGAYSHVSPGVNIAGSVVVGEGVWLGIGSSVVNNIFIHEDAIVGAGSTVIRSIDAPGTYVGVPVRKL